MDLGKKNRKQIKVLLYLHLLLVFYSFSGILGKMAASCDFLSIHFILCYSGLILLMGVYAVFWQQIIKELPLSLAYANKSIMVIWGMIWGHLFFDESISLQKGIGSMVVMVGIVLFAISDQSDDMKKDGDIER